MKIKSLLLCCLLVAAGSVASGQAVTKTVPAAVTGSVAASSTPSKSQPTFGLSDIQVLQREVGGYPLWQYLASLNWTILAFVVDAQCRDPDIHLAGLG